MIKPQTKSLHSSLHVGPELTTVAIGWTKWKSIYPHCALSVIYCFVSYRNGLYPGPVTCIAPLNRLINERIDQTLTLQSFHVSKCAGCFFSFSVLELVWNGLIICVFGEHHMFDGETEVVSFVCLADLEYFLECRRILRMWRDVQNFVVDNRLLKLMMFPEIDSYYHFVLIMGAAAFTGLLLINLLLFIFYLWNSTISPV